MNQDEFFRHCLKQGIKLPRDPDKNYHALKFMSAWSHQNLAHAAFEGQGWARTDGSEPEEGAFHVGTCENDCCINFTVLPDWVVDTSFEVYRQTKERLTHQGHVDTQEAIEDIAKQAASAWAEREGYCIRKFQNFN